MSETGVVSIAVAMMGLLGVISTALSSIVIARLNTMRRDVAAVNRDVAAVKHEVKNDHDTNLRTEQDVRHSENSEKLDYLVGAVAWLIQGWQANRDDIDELQEHTGQSTSRRARRLARSRPIDHTEIPPPGKAPS